MGREWIGRWISIGGLLFRTVGRQFSHHKRLPSSTPSAPVVLCQEFLVLDSRIVSDQHGSQVRTEKKKKKEKLEDSLHRPTLSHPPPFHPYGSHPISYINRFALSTTSSLSISKIVYNNSRFLTTPNTTTRSCRSHTHTHVPFILNAVCWPIQHQPPSFLPPSFPSAFASSPTQMFHRGVDRKEKKKEEKKHK